MELCLLSHAEWELRAPVLQDASSAPVTNVTQCHLRYCGVVGVWFHESRLGHLSQFAHNKKALKLLARSLRTVRNKH